MAAAEVETREGHLTSADGTRLFWRSWEVERPAATFAVIHGLGEHSGRYRRFAEAMAKRGFATFAVDLRGMGRSDGRRGFVDRWEEWIRDAEALISMLVDHPTAGEVIPVGHSFGGVVLLSGVIREVIVTGRFVLSNPALRLRVRVPGWKRSFGLAASRWAPTLALSNEVDAGTVSRDPVVVAEYRSDPLVHDRITARLFSEFLGATDEIRARAAEIRTPFLLIASEGDRLVDPEGSRELDRAATVPHVARFYPERAHEPFNDLGAEEVFDDLAAWVAREPAPAP